MWGRFPAVCPFLATTLLVVCCTGASKIVKNYCFAFETKQAKQFYVLRVPRWMPCTHPGPAVASRSHASVAVIFFSIFSTFRKIEEIEEIIRRLLPHVWSFFFFVPHKDRPICPVLSSLTDLDGIIIIIRSIHLASLPSSSSQAAAEPPLTTHPTICGNELGQLYEC